eukprot:IDg19955t1
MGKLYQKSHASTGRRIATHAHEAHAEVAATAPDCSGVHCRQKPVARMAAAINAQKREYERT